MILTSTSRVGISTPMGFFRLMKALSDNKLGQRANFSYLRGKRVAVDVSGIAYQRVRNNIDDVIRIMENDDVSPIVREVSDVTSRLLQVCSQVIMVFDGNHPSCPCKAITSISRQIRQGRDFAAGLELYRQNPDDPAPEAR